MRINKIAAAEAADLCAGLPSGGRVVVFNHPLVQHKVGIIRSRDTSAKEFRELLQEIAGLMVYEITRNLPLTDVEVETPLAVTRARTLEGKKLAIVPVLRAGLGMVDGILQLVPNAKVGHIGLYRDPETQRGGQKVSLVCLIAAPEGIERVHREHPEADIFIAALDSHLNDHGYIVPGLGDAGDRLYGTK